MRPRLLSAAEFAATCNAPMENITGQEAVHQPEGVIDLAPYIRAIPHADMKGHTLLGDDVVEYVYRCGDKTYDHVGFPCHRQNVFLVVVVQLSPDQPYGHHVLDLNREYGITERPA